MIIELRSLLPALQEEENSRNPGKKPPEAGDFPVADAEPVPSGPLSAEEEKHHGEENAAGAAPVVKAEIRSADPAPAQGGAPLAASQPEWPFLPEVSLPRESGGVAASQPEWPFRPEVSLPRESGEVADAFHDDRVPELLERLLGAAERSADFSEQIAGLMEQQNSVSAPAYA